MRGLGVVVALGVALGVARANTMALGRTLALRRRPALALAAPATFLSADEAAEFALDNAMAGLRFYTYALDASVLLPLVPFLGRIEPLRPAMTLLFAITRPYFAAWQRFLPLPAGLSYIPAFMAVSAANRELAKCKLRRALSRDRLDAAAFAHLYSS